MPARNYDKELLAVMGALAESIESASDEDLLSEVQNDGEDIEVVAEEVRGWLLVALKDQLKIGAESEEHVSVHHLASRGVGEKSFPQKDVEENDFLIVSDPSRSYHERCAAFQKLLSRNRGWWGKGSIFAFARADARAIANRISKTKIGKYSVDRIDPEGIAQEALIVLFERAHTVKEKGGPSKKWFRGVIQNLVRQAIRKNRLTLTMEKIPENFPASAPDDPSETEKNGRRQYDALYNIISGMKPSEKTIVLLMLDGFHSHKAIAEALNISHAAARKRWERARKSLERALRPEDPSKE